MNMNFSLIFILDWIRQTTRSFDDDDDTDEHENEDESCDERRTTTEIPPRQRSTSITGDKISKKQKRTSERQDRSTLGNLSADENAQVINSQIDINLNTTTSSSSVLKQLTNNVIPFREQIGELTKS